MGLAGNAISAYNLGGTAATYAASGGSLFGINPNVQAQGGATYLYAVMGGEIDIRVFSGASTVQKYGLLINQGPQDAVQGSIDDAALAFTNNSAAIGWERIISIGRVDGSGWPYPGTGENTTLFKTWGAHTIDYGIDISATTCRTACFKSNGWYIDGSGISWPLRVNASGAGAATFPTFSYGEFGMHFVSTTGLARRY